MQGANTSLSEGSVTSVTKLFTYNSFDTKKPRKAWVLAKWQTAHLSERKKPSLVMGNSSVWTKQP